MNLINTENRTAAKRLLNSWFDSREVRMMRLDELNAALNRSINEGLITVEGARRALAPRDVIQNNQDSKGDGVDGDKGEQDAGKVHGDGKGEQEKQGDADVEQQGDSESDDGEQEQEQDGEQEQEQDGEQEQDSNDEQQEQQQEQDNDAPWRHASFNDVLRWVKAGQNVALVGPAGSGKSTIAAHVAEEIGAEFFGTGALLSKYDLIGYNDANGNYHATPMYHAYTEGGLFCFDEMDASAPDACVAFNGITDHQKRYAFPNGMQTKHANFKAIACMNTWGNGATSDYVGRYKQDAAAMSRFVKVFINYDDALEERLAGKHKDILHRVRDLRACCANLGIKHVASTRMILQAVAGREVGKIKNPALDRDVFFAGLDDSAIAQLRTAMNKLKADRNANGEAA